MKSRNFFAICLLMAGCVLLFTAFGHAQAKGPKYDFANEVKVKGTIEEIKMVPGEYEGVHVMIKTPTETTLVHLAPEAFLKMLDYTVKKGDTLEVTGCKVTGEFGPEVIAREMVSGNNELTLRDKKGMPAWAGMKFEAGN